MKKLGATASYNKDPLFQIGVKMFFALVTVPAGYVQDLYVSDIKQFFKVFNVNLTNIGVKIYFLIWSFLS